MKKRVIVLDTNVFLHDIEKPSIINIKNSEKGEENER